MRRTLVAVVALVAFLAMAAGAGAKAVKMRGSAQGDQNSKISLKVKLSKSGVPKKLKYVKYSGLDLFVYDPTSGELGDQCPGEVSGKFKKFSFHRGPAPSEFSWSGAQTVGGLSHSTNGAMPYLNPKGAAGSISFEQADGSFCQSADFHLNAKRGGGHGSHHS
jgi:hypothetical protein